MGCLGGGEGGGVFLASTGHLQIEQQVPAFCIVRQLGQSVIWIITHLRMLSSLSSSNIRATTKKDSNYLPRRENRLFLLSFGSGTEVAPCEGGHTRWQDVATPTRQWCRVFLTVPRVGGCRISSGWLRAAGGSGPGLSRRRSRSFPTSARRSPRARPSGR